MITILIIVAVITAAIIIFSNRYDEHLRERFTDVFGVDAPSKKACPEEKAAIRDITRRHVADCLAAAKGYAGTKSSSKDIETIRTSYENEQNLLRDADQTFNLARYFGLVPKDVKIPEDFVRTIDSEATAHM